MGGPVSAGLVAAGVKESLTTVIAGLFICLGSSVAWFVLRARCRKLSA